MKRLLPIVLAISVLTVLLVGCTAPAQQPENTTDINNQQQNNTDTTANGGDIVFTQKPMYSISLPPITESAHVDDGTEIFNYSYQNISLILPEQEVADKVILDFLNRMDKVTGYAETALESAKLAYSTASQWRPYLLQILYAPMRLDSGVLSLHGNKVSYTGGAHSVYTGESVSYDLLTGNALSLTDIISQETSADTLTKLICNALAATEVKEHLFDSYVQTIKQLIGTDLSTYQDWYFTGTGLCFHFDLNEIAPFSSGSIVVEIPYSQLASILKNAYFPGEEDITAGSVEVERFTESALEKYTQFSEVVLEENTNKILLHTKQSVCDIRLHAALRNNTSKETQYHMVFAAYSLTPGDAIMVEADLTQWELILTYRVGSDQEQYSISNNGDTVLLTEK